MARRRHSPDLKAKVAVEALRERKSVNELASQYEVHPVQVGEWKRKLLKASPEVFANGGRRREQEEEALKASLYQEIGRLRMELSWLGEKSGRLG